MRIPSKSKTPEYGIDAPGVVAGFLASGFASVTIGLLVLTHVLRWPTILGCVLLAISVVPLMLGVSMLLYAFVGKQRFRDHLLRQRSWRGDETVVDIGAGRGLMAIGAALRVPHGRVIAIDIWSTKDLSANTPEGLRENARLEGVERLVEILTADARQLDFPDAGVDVVVSVFCIHNIQPPEERHKVCREIARVLKTRRHCPNRRLSRRRRLRGCLSPTGVARARSLACRVNSSRHSWLSGRD